METVNLNLDLNLDIPVQVLYGIGIVVGVFVYFMFGAFVAGIHKWCGVDLGQDDAGGAAIAIFYSI